MINITESIFLNVGCYGIANILNSRLCLVFCCVDLFWQKDLHLQVTRIKSKQLFILADTGVSKAAFLLHSFFLDFFLTS